MVIAVCLGSGRTPRPTRPAPCPRGPVPAPCQRVSVMEGTGTSGTSTLMRQSPGRPSPTSHTAPSRAAPAPPAAPPLLSSLPPGGPAPGSHRVRSEVSSRSAARRSSRDWSMVLSSVTAATSPSPSAGTRLFYHFLFIHGVEIHLYFQSLISIY